MFKLGDKVKIKKFPHIKGEIWEIHQVSCTPTIYGVVREDKYGYFGDIYRYFEEDIELLDEK